MRWLAAALVLGFALSAQADIVEIEDGRTSISFSPGFVELLAAFEVANIIPTDDIPPADGYTYGFDINSREADPSTTFQYDSDDFENTFSGTIEHTGILTFTDSNNEVILVVGNFSADYASGRGDDVTGFFVRNTIGEDDFLIPLFDIANPTSFAPAVDGLTLEADLLISPELAAVFQSNNLAGSLAGQILVEAQVPEPASALLGLLGIGLAAIVFRRRF